MRQKLITKQIEKALAKYPLYSQDGKGKEAIVLTKFFTPWGRFTWYVLEAEKQPNGDYLFFGYVKGLEDEYGYFTLSDLKSIRGPWGLSIERDMYIDVAKQTLAEMLGEKKSVMAK